MVTAHICPRRATRWVFALVVCLEAVSRVGGISAQEEQKRVLVLHASRRDAQITVTVESSGRLARTSQLSVTVWPTLVLARSVKSLPGRKSTVASTPWKY